MQDDSLALQFKLASDDSLHGSFRSLSQEIAEALCERANSLHNSHPSVIVGKDRRLIDGLLDVAAAIRPKQATSNRMDDIQPIDGQISNADHPMDCGGDPSPPVDLGSKKSTSKRKRMRKRIVQSLRRFKNLHRFTYTDRRGKEHKLRWSKIKTTMQPFYEERVQPVFKNWGEVGRRVAASVMQKRNHWFRTTSLKASDTFGEGQSSFPMKFETNDKFL